MMKIGTINPLKALMLLFMATSLVVFTSCSSDDDGDDDTDPEPTQTILEIAQGEPQLSELVSYLSAYPDLVDLLGAPGDLTVFAPTNAAFESLLATPGFPQDVESINPDIIEEVLAYHVSSTRYESDDLTSGTTITTLSSQNEQITVNPDGTLLTGATNSAIEIATADIQATNGVVHTTASVLIPPSIGSSLAPILGTNAGTLLLGADFSILASAINKADVYAAENSLPTLVSILSGEADHTVFAPSNATFEAADLTADSFDGATWYGIIANHVVTPEGFPSGETPGVITPGDLTLGATFTSAAGATLTVAATDAPTTPEILTGIVINGGSPDGNAQVAIPGTGQDGLDNSNGVVHVIAGILLPPSPQ